jgi:predicted transglutaminase-like cysteine proteinase
MAALSRVVYISFVLLAQAGLVHTFPAAAGSAKEQRPAWVVLTAQHLNGLQQVNRHVNSTIAEVSDLEQNGREGVWRLPTRGKGDCENFALLKRKLLIDTGRPASVLVVPAVQTAQGEPHVVLTARTDKGDYALDNKTSETRPLSATGYLILSQQSQTIPGKWISAGTGEETDQPVADVPLR